MATFQSFEEIDAWQESRTLLRAVRTICNQPHVKHDDAFVGQITRAGRSVSANIAEGFESLTSQEFIRFLGYSKRSAGEVRSHLYDALDERYISQQQFDDLADRTRKICSMLAKLIHYLQSLDNNRRRTSSSSPPTAEHPNEERTNE